MAHDPGDIAIAVLNIQMATIQVLEERGVLKPGDYARILEIAPKTNRGGNADAAAAIIAQLAAQTGR